MALYTGSNSSTLAQARADLRKQLGDSTFWADAELDLYLREGLRFWGAVTRQWRKRENLVLTQGASWYDLYALSSNLNPTVTDRDILEEIQYHLLETVNRTGWSGTSQFDLATVVDAMQGALDEVYAVTALKLERFANRAFGISDFHQVDDLAPAVTAVRRVAWKDPDGVRHVLWRADEDEQRFYSPLWSTGSGTPQAFSMWASAPLQLRVMPRPNLPGTLDLVVQRAAPTLDPATGVELGIPDDLSWVAKYGALATLLRREGQATDRQRAEYCQQRFEDGLEIAKAYPSVLAVELQGIPAQVGSVWDLDSYRPGWESETQATPTTWAHAGYNLVAVAPVPDLGPNSALVDLVAPAPVPTADADVLQIGPDGLVAVVDYAQALASFKQGGEEFVDTLEALAGATEAALRVNKKMASESWAKQAQDARSWIERVKNPLEQPSERATTRRSRSMEEE